MAVLFGNAFCEPTDKVDSVLGGDCDPVEWCCEPADSTSDSVEWNGNADDRSVELSVKGRALGSKVGDDCGERLL
jgi:hypothetical protein